MLSCAPREPLLKKGQCWQEPHPPEDLAQPVLTLGAEPDCHFISGFIEKETVMSGDGGRE